MFLDKKESTFKEHGKCLVHARAHDIMNVRLERFFRQVKGVIQIDIDDRKDNCRATISIYAETEDAAKRARQVPTDWTKPSTNPYFPYSFVTS